MSKAILELQKDRFFESLTARYWNHSAKESECPNSDESEGITLESLGGVFIATLFGLLLAMITLVIEVVYYRRREARENAIKKITNVAPASNITPPPSYDAGRLTNANDQITIGEKFVPNPNRVSSISVYSRRPIHSTNDETGMPYIE